MANGLLLGPNLLLFAFDGGGLFDLLHTVGEQIDLCLLVVRVAGELLAAGEDLLPAGIGGRIGGLFLFGMGIHIENMQLAGRLEERLMIMRSMQIHQQRPKPFQQGEGHGHIVDNGLTAARRLDLPSENEQSVPAGIQSGLLQHGVDPLGMCKLKGGLDQTLAFTCTDGGGVGPFPQQQGQRPDQNGFSRSGFTGDDVQACFKGNSGLLHEGEILHSQHCQHEGRIAHCLPTGKGEVEFPFVKIE